MTVDHLLKKEQSDRSVVSPEEIEDRKTACEVLKDALQMLEDGGLQISAEHHRGICDKIESGISKIQNARAESVGWMDKL